MMAEIRLSEWINRPDWEIIWKAISCPQCLADIGEPCRTKAPYRSLASYQHRIEPHMERVWIAIEVQYEKENVKEV